MELGIERLTKLLLDLDEEARLVFGCLEKKMPLIIVGGSAFILNRLTKRPVTHDVDILSADRRLMGIVAAYPELNGNAAAFCDTVPCNYEDRLVSLDLPTTTVAYFVPSLEDLAVMKLYAWRPNDIDDLTNTDFLAKVDWEKLDHLVMDAGEARASCLSDRRYNEMLATYRRYVCEWRDGKWLR